MAGEAGEEVVTAGVGDGDVGLAKDYAVALHNFYVGEVDYKGAVDAHKTVGREQLFNLFHTYELADRLAVFTVEDHTVVLYLDV